jgi:hypothetical protein
MDDVWKIHPFLGKYSKHAQFRNRWALPRQMNWGVMTLPVRQHEGIFDIRDTT